MKTLFGNEYIISGESYNNCIAYFGNNHIHICNSLALKYHIINYDGKRQWSKLLKALGYKVDKRNNGAQYFPVFPNVTELEHFLLSLETEFRINII